MFGLVTHPQLNKENVLAVGTNRTLNTSVTVGTVHLVWWACNIFATFSGVTMLFVCKYANSKLMIIGNSVHLSWIVLRGIWEQKVEKEKGKEYVMESWFSICVQPSLTEENGHGSVSCW